MRLTKIKTVGVTGLRDGREFTFAPIQGFVGESGSGKSSVLAAIEAANRGRITGSALVSVPQTNDGVLRFARDGKGLVVDAEGVSDEHGNWSVTREYETTLVQPRAKRGEAPQEARPTVSQHPRQSFVAASGDDEHGRAIAEYWSTLPGIWNPREILSASAGEARKRLLGQLWESGTLAEYLPADAPEWLRVDLHLDPEAWVRVSIQRLRRELSEDRGVVAAKLSVVADSVGGKEIDLAPLERARDRAVADLAAYDAASGRVAARQAAERELEDARAHKALITRPNLDTEPLSAELADARRVAKIEVQLAESPPAAIDPVSDSEIEAATETASLEAAAIREGLARTSTRIRLTAEIARLRDEYRDATVQIERLSNLLCPHCKRPVEVVDLEAQQARADSVRARGEAAKAELAALPEIAPIVGTPDQDALAKLIDRRKRAESQRHEIVARERLEAELDGFRNRGIRSVAAIEADLRVAREIDLAAQRVARAESHLAGLAEGSGPSGHRPDLVDALERAKAAHSAAVEKNTEIRQRIRSEQTARETQALVDSRKVWLAKLETLQGDLLSTVTSRLIAPLRELTGLKYEIQLSNARGHEDCQFRLGSAYASTFSGGETVRFLAGLFGALYRLTPREKCRWRVLAIDQIETVSKGARDGFVASLRANIADGVFDQVILSGCPDSGLGIRSVTDLSKEG